MLICSCSKTDGNDFSVRQSAISYALCFTFIFYQGAFLLNVLIDNGNVCIQLEKMMNIFRSHFITELEFLASLVVLQNSIFIIITI